MAVILDGEACWGEIIEAVEEGDKALNDAIEMMEDNGMDLEAMGYPTHEDYLEMKEKVETYTSGEVLMTSWKWDSDAVQPGHSVGLCMGESEPSTSYWSCWAFTMAEDGTYPKTPSSYLIDPATWTSESSLDTYEDITEGTFPSMYGGWTCMQPKEWNDMMHADCMRFLPSQEYSTASNSTDVRFASGPMQIATYLTSRAEESTGENTVEALAAEESMFETFSIDLSDYSESGAWSGISAIGFALASICLLAF